MWFYYALSRLPLWVLYLISDGIYFLLRYLVKYRLGVVRCNVVNSFPEKTNKEIDSIINRFYRNTADMIVETIKLLTISAEELNRRVSVKNPDAIWTYFHNGTSVLLTACHQYNWEWMVAVGRTKIGYPFNPAYRPLKNQFFNDLIIKVRSRFGGTTIVDKDLKSTLRNNSEVVGFSLVMDHLSGKPYQWRRFLGQETLFDNSIEILANLSQMPVLYPKLKKLSRGYYEVELVPIAAPPYNDESGMLGKFVKAVETSIKEQPDTWMWTHKRWKYQKEVIDS